MSDNSISSHKTHSTDLTPQPSKKTEEHLPLNPIEALTDSIANNTLNNSSKTSNSAIQINNTIHNTPSLTDIFVTSEILDINQKIDANNLFATLDGDMPLFDFEPEQISISTPPENIDANQKLDANNLFVTADSDIALFDFEPEQISISTPPENIDTNQKVDKNSLFIPDNSNISLLDNTILSHKITNTNQKIISVNTTQKSSNRDIKPIINTLSKIRFKPSEVHMQVTEILEGFTYVFQDKNKNLIGKKINFEKLSENNQKDAISYFEHHVFEHPEKPNRKFATKHGKDFIEIVDKNNTLRARRVLNQVELQAVDSKDKDGSLIKVDADDVIKQIRYQVIKMLYEFVLKNNIEIETNKTEETNNKNNKEFLLKQLNLNRNSDKKLSETANLIVEDIIGYELRKNRQKLLKQFEKNIEEERIRKKEIIEEDKKQLNKIKKKESKERIKEEIKQDKFSQDIQNETLDYFYQKHQRPPLKRGL